MPFDKFLTVFEIAADLQVTRQRVHQIIKEYNLSYTKVGTVFLVDKVDYNKYAKLRKRRDLAAVAGRSETRFIRTAIRDTVCSICGSFAVNWEGTVACESGHVEDAFLHDCDIEGCSTFNHVVRFRVKDKYKESE